jgi:hypothetical protein
MAANTVTLLGVGDVGPLHEPVAAYSELAKPTLAAADIRFGQVERVYSERGSLQLHSGGAHSRVKPHMASVFTDCGFDVVSLAGKNLEESRRLAIVEKNGVKVAFLAYCSILQTGYAAGHGKAGIAPLRAHTYYEAFDYQAGVPPRVVTVPHEEDLAGLIEDVTTAKKAADVVVLSLHWGIHFVPRVIADYQVTAANAAFRAGADLILGHHAHTPKAIGVHQGKACFYSLSNFIMSSTAKSPEKAATFEKRYGVTLDPDYPHLSYGSDAKRSLVAKAVIARDGVKRVSFLPVLIDKKLRPEVLRQGDPRFDDALRFMEWVSEDFDHRFVVTGDEVVVTGKGK